MSYPGFDIPLFDRYIAHVTGDFTRLVSGVPNGFLMHDFCATVNGKVYIGASDVPLIELPIIEWLTHVWEEALGTIVWQQSRFTSGPISVSFSYEIPLVSGKDDRDREPRVVVRPASLKESLNILCQIRHNGKVLDETIMTNDQVLQWVRTSSWEVADRIVAITGSPVLPPALDAYFNLLRSLTEDRPMRNAIPDV
jgi:hypothetical protein